MKKPNIKIDTKNVLDLVVGAAGIIVAVSKFVSNKKDQEIWEKVKNDYSGNNKGN